MRKKEFVPTAPVPHTGNLMCCAEYNEVCDNNPIAHVAFRHDRSGYHAIVLCNPCFALFKENYTYIDVHFATVSCNMPGGRWTSQRCTI